MAKPISPLYSIRHPNAKKLLDNRIASGCHHSLKKPLVFFRADDIGIPSERFSQLIRCFQKHRLPLCLATVPSWATESRLSELRRLTGESDSQWHWHQHGRIHRNFEKYGKKQEFGPARSKQVIYDNLLKGKKRLEKILGKQFSPVFTPPWNRCSEDTLLALADLDFKAVSRSTGAHPDTLINLPDFQVNVDLHTRKEASPHIAFENLMTEIEKGLASGRCGIMIHHQRINRAGIEMLDLLLGLIKSNKHLVPVHFGDLLLQESPLLSSSETIKDIHP